jgi:LysR family transcriptional regulator for bpeEF and oprC
MQMDRFQAMQVFMGVVDANSFSRAADSLNLPRATVTTTIQSLENLLKVRLLNRTTRSISLTPDVAQRPQGRLRIDVPSTLGRQILIPKLCDFRTRYPDIELVIGMGDRPVDLVQEAVGCVIRGGELVDSTLVARRIGSLSFITCVTPSYLERHGEPQTLEELQQNHEAIQYFSSRTGRVIDRDYMIDGVRTEVKIKGTVAINDADGYMALALKGVGMVQAARFMALPYLESGALVEILKPWKPAPLPISVLYPQNRHLSPKVRAFTDWAAELFANCPLLSGRETGDDNYSGECTFVGTTGGNTVRDMVEQRNIAEAVL